MKKITWKIKTRWMGVSFRQLYSFDTKSDYDWEIIFTEKCFLYLQEGYILFHVN